MNIQREFTGNLDFQTLLLYQLEKEIEKSFYTSYNKNIGIVALRQ